LIQSLNGSDGDVRDSVTYFTKCKKYVLPESQLICEFSIFHEFSSPKSC